LDTGREICCCLGHLDHVTALVYSPDGKTIASGSLDATIRLWNSETGKQIRQIKVVTGLDLNGFVSGGVHSLAFSSDGIMLASGCHDSSIRIWNARSGELITQCKGHEREIFALFVFPDSRSIASCSRDRTIRLWDTRTGRQFHQIDCPFADG